MKEYRFFQADVFTDRPFTGNPLAIFPEAEGLVEAKPTARILVEQGYEMGRPSAIHVEVDADESGPTEVRVGGKAVEVAEGKLRF